MTYRGVLPLTLHHLFQRVYLLSFFCEEASFIIMKTTPATTTTAPT